MALAFGIGVIVGPTPKPIPASDTLSSSSSDGIPNDTEKITNARRQQTKHATEIGKKITNVDLNEKHVNFQQPVLEDFGDGTGAVKMMLPQLPMASMMKSICPRVNIFLSTS